MNAFKEDRLDRAILDLPLDGITNIKVPSVPLSYLWQFLRDGETPGRVLNDYALRAFMPFLQGSGSVYELGGSGDYYRHFVSSTQSYIVTNIDNSRDIVIDATQMEFPSASIDAFCSMFALEHIFEFEAVISEVYRCLKPGGRFMLAVPFLYYYHGAPDDFLRFTHSAMAKMLTKFRIARGLSLGNRSLVLAQFFHEKPVLGSTKSWVARTALRFITAPVLWSGLVSNQRDPVFAITQLYMCEKEV